MASPSLTRRGLLLGLSGVVTAAALPLGCREAVSPDAPLHERIAAQARRMGAKAPIRVLYPKGSLGNLTPVASLFTALTDIPIAPIEASLDEISAEIILSSSVDQDSRFDVALPATFGIPDLVEAEAILPLDGLAAELAAELAESLYPLGDRYKGRLYGYQTDGDVYVMFYNRDWLADPQQQAAYSERFGVPLSVPQTWAELDRQMAFFHAPDAGRYGGSLFRNLNYIAWEFWSRLHGQGIYPLSDDMEPRLNTPEALAALTQLIAANDSLAPDVWSAGLFDNFAAFAEGNRYCNIGWGGTQKHLHTSPMRERLAFGPLPGGVLGGSPVAMPYFNWGWNYVVSARTAIAQLAHLFILFATTPHVSTRSVREASGYFDPFRPDHYTDSVIVETYGADFLGVHQESLSACIPDLYLRGQGRYLQVLKQAVHSAALGQLTPEQALSALNDRWQRLTDELGRDSQIEQWRYLRRSYPASLQALLT